MEKTDHSALKTYLIIHKKTLHFWVPQVGGTKVGIATEAIEKADGESWKPLFNRHKRKEKVKLITDGGGIGR